MRRQQDADKEAAAQAVADAAGHMGRSLDTQEIKDLLYRNYESPHWDNVAARCLSCANCTMVCPTCFCATVEDTTDLTGEQRRALAPMGFVLHGGFFLHTWRQRARHNEVALSPMVDSQTGHLD